MSGSEPVQVAVQDGLQCLRFPCRFTGLPVQRGSWDRRVTLDLSAAEGIHFQVLCRDASPVSYFSIYFQSGDGWYHASFFPESSSGWNTISIPKTEMVAEGTPAGWAHIKAIRLSAWRGREQDTEFYFANLRKTGVLGADAGVAIVRCESGARQNGGEKRSVDQFTGTVAEWLKESGVACTVLNDTDLSAGSLDKARLVILPYNPSMPEAVAAELRRLLARGTRMMAFYTVPETLAPALNVIPGNHVKAPRPGAFAGLRLTSGALPAAPRSVAQDSWNITAFQPVSGRARVIAEWVDSTGKPVGYPALLASSNSVVMSHVLLRDDAVAKKRLLLAMAGSLVPQVWQEAARAAVENISTLSEFRSYDDAVAKISGLGGTNVRVKAVLAKAEQSRRAAARLLASKKYAEVIEPAAAAKDLLLQAFCLAQPASPGEFRAFWCHSAFGVQGLSWDDAVGRLGSNGFNAVIPNMLWGGVAFYPSKVLPVAPQVVQRGDQVRECLAAARKHGVQVHVWKVNWNLGSAAPEAFVQQMREAHRLQASAGGVEQRWLCPSHPENRNLEIASMVELARDYDLDGIHFDYIRYPDGDHCFCAGCRERFQAGPGSALQQWPKDVLEGGPLRQQWLDWRRDNITAVVKAVSEQARAVRPKLKISAAVFNNWTADRDGVGQDWKLWCEKGYVDFVCPMDYTSSNRNFENMVLRQKAWAGNTPYYPGIGYSASQSHFGPDKAIDQIDITRRLKTGGFVIFNYGVSESRELLPLLGSGITRNQP